jgi:hypothetical protein
MNTSTSPFPYTDIFYKQFSYYLSIGMTEEQYWDKDCLLVKYYREAEELRNEKLNQHAWLQGMYIYDALNRVAPILHAFAKKGTKAQPYVEQAYPISKRSAQEARENEEKVKAQKGIRFMEAYMVQNNKRFEERK